MISISSSAFRMETHLINYNSSQSATNNDKEKGATPQEFLLK